MQMSTERMNDKLNDEPDPDLTDYCNTADVQYSVLNNPRNHGKRPFCQSPFKVATACLTAFCLLLLMVLVATKYYSKSSSVQDLPSSPGEPQKILGCPIALLSIKLTRLKRQNSDLEAERSHLKIKITALEAAADTKCTSVTAKGSCPDNWHYFQGSCYFISEESESWPQSQAYCKLRGGHLAIVLTADEQTFIWNLLPRGHWNAYWFGITDEETEDDWRWVDGTKLVGGFWEPGEPNNDNNEDCGYMVKTMVLDRVATKSWYDAPCQMSRPRICEKAADVRKEKSDLEEEISQLKNKIAALEASAATQCTPVQVPTQHTPVTAKASCPDNWDYFDGSCYFISSLWESWPQSQAYCKQKGGHLAIVLTADEQTFIWNLLPRGHWNAYWIGITDEETEDDWRWVDGTKLVGGFWEDGEPNNHINEDCGYMIKTTVLSRIATKSWYDAPCEMYRPWICEKKADASS
ncbi:C-type mannose receptor 2-like [Misgurnus anguillicaudatus]|uniref:C-type mannose receptor 2-like n=1 Tax=Misgurnus anguillicaudatus TaxID=75329 RepID=UPI003CCF72E1